MSELSEAEVREWEEEHGEVREWEEKHGARAEEWAVGSYYCSSPRPTSWHLQERLGGWTGKEW